MVAEKDNSGRKIKEIRAFRPEIAHGQVKEVKAADDRFTFTVDLGDGKSKDLQIAVPKDLKIRFNGQTELAGQPVKLADLRPGDRVDVHHLGKETGREATELAVERVVDVEGKIVEVKTDEAKNEQVLTLNVGTDEKPQLTELPFAPDCEVTINGRQLANDQVLKPADLKPGDKATVAHDSRVVKVTAHRIIHDSGAIGTVQDGALDVIRQGEDKPTRYAVGEKCAVTFNGEPAKLSDLSAGDVVEITHESIDGKNLEATSVAAQRPEDQTRWAILIGVQAYDRPLGKPAGVRGGRCEDARRRAGAPLPGARRPGAVVDR